MADQPKQKPQQQPKKVPASAFYDATSLKRLRPDQEVPSSSRPKRAAQLFNPLHAPFKTFKTQAAAFEFLDAQACSSILRTFALETAETGRREFTVASEQLFWQTYAALPAKQRHHYEIIRQGTPCNLYFGELEAGQADAGRGPSTGSSLVTILSPAACQPQQAVAGGGSPPATHQPGRAALWHTTKGTSNHCVTHRTRPAALAVAPCTDLEFSPEVNSGLNGPRLVELLVTGMRHGR